jgi:hypothetical protein
MRTTNSTLADSVSERAHVRCLVAALNKTVESIIPPDGPLWQATFPSLMRKIRTVAKGVGEMRSMKSSQDGLGAMAASSFHPLTDLAMQDNGSSHAAAKEYRSRETPVARAPAAITA